MGTDTTTYPAPRTSPPDILSVERPWGNFKLFVDNEVVSVKIITAKADQELSLQTHKWRSEWWTVLSGSMEVTIDDTKKVLGVGERIFISCGAKHRARALETGCQWLEIMFGHFDENDITRLADDYGRV